MTNEIVIDEVVEQRAFRKVCTRERLRDKFDEALKKVIKRVTAGKGEPREVAQAFYAHRIAVNMYNEALDQWFEYHMMLHPKNNLITEDYFLDDEVPF